MSVLTGGEIHFCYEEGFLNISPWSKDNLRSTSYVLHLGNTLMKYNQQILDIKEENSSTYTVNIGESFVLQPNTIYLADTRETVSSGVFTPLISGVEKCALKGINIDMSYSSRPSGFGGRIRLKISCTQQIRIYSGIEICHISFIGQIPENE